MSKRRPVSIRTRLTWWYTATFAAGLVVFALASWIVARGMLYSYLAQDLRQRERSFETFIREEVKVPGVHLTEELEEYSHGLPAGTSVWLTEERRGVVFASAAGVEVPPVADDGRRWQVWRLPASLTASSSLALDGRRLRIVGAIDAGQTIALLGGLGMLLITMSPALLLIASLGGFLLSRRALQPVDEMTRAAKTMSIQDLSSRLATPGTGDELQRLCETWNSMLDRLQDAVQQLTRFTQDASHELRTPLAIIRSTAEIAARRSRSEQAYRTALEQIVEESDRLTGLVESLLLLARGDQREAIAWGEVDLSKLVGEVCREAAALAEPKKIRLEMSPSPELSTIRADEAMVRRLLIVLVENALNYSPLNSAVTVRVLRVEGSTEMQVIDQGIGIPEHEVEHIFERFYRGEVARQFWREGAGLGLSLAVSIVEQHGATISVQSELGRGSVFGVRFPAATAAV